MTFVGWDTLENIRTRYGTSGLPAVVDAAQSFLCGLNDSRFSFTNYDPSGFGNYVSGAWDRVCDQKNDIPFDLAQKGRCRWLFSYEIPVNNAFNPNPAPNEIYAFVSGSWATPVVTPRTNDAVVLVRNQDNTSGNVVTTYGSGRTWDPSYGPARLVGEVIDFCESAPNEVAPPIPPLAITPGPPVGDLSRTSPVQIAPNLIVPLFFTYVRPTFNAEFNANFQIDIRPTINLPDLNLSLTFDVAGIEFNFYGGGDAPPFLPPQPDPRSPIPLPPAEPDEECDLTPVLTKLAELEECACPGSPGSVLFLGEGSSGVFALPEEALGVFVSITEFPANLKVESGRDAPDVYYAGWASMARGANGGTRNPINYQSNWYIRGKLDSHFWFTCRTGFQATAVALLKQT